VFDHPALYTGEAHDAIDVPWHVQINMNAKESSRRYAHLMLYSGLAATEQMLLDGSC
jgi:hypothetical protein